MPGLPSCGARPAGKTPLNALPRQIAPFRVLIGKLLSYIPNHMRAQALSAIIICLLLAGCLTSGPVPGAGPTSTQMLDPTPVEYSPDELSKHLVTLCRTDHQGFHEVRRAEAQVSPSGDLSVVFTPDLPAYWLGMELLIKDGRFQARPFGEPFAPGKVTFEVNKQELILQKNPATPYFVVNGCTSVNFTQRGADGSAAPYFFTGCFSAMLIRESSARELTPDYLSFIAAQELAVAAYELGEPLHDARFTAGAADRFRSAVLGSQISSRTEIREITWNASSTAQISDAGQERLSVWYSRQGDQWFPVAHRVWSSGDPAFPAYLSSAAD